MTQNRATAACIISSVPSGLDSRACTLKHIYPDSGHHQGKYAAQCSYQNGLPFVVSELSTCLPAIDPPANLIVDPSAVVISSERISPVFG